MSKSLLKSISNSISDNPDDYPDSSAFRNWQDIDARIKSELLQESEEKKLIEFAKRTLATLQNTEEWSSDTTDEIDTHAGDLGLRILDGESRFVATVKLA